MKLVDRLDLCMEALALLEWRESPYGTCLECERTKDDGHTESCIIGKALFIEPEIDISQIIENEPSVYLLHALTYDQGDGLVDIRITVRRTSNASGDEVRSAIGRISKGVSAFYPLGKVTVVQKS